MMKSWRVRSSPAKGWAAARAVVAAREGRSRAREEIRIQGESFSSREGKGLRRETERRT